MIEGRINDMIKKITEVIKTKAVISFGRQS